MPDTTNAAKLILVTRNGWPERPLPESAQPALRRQPESDPAKVLDSAPDARVVLAAPLDQTTAWIKELLRRKRHFALASLSEINGHDLVQLAAAAHKRRLTPVVLGSWRCLPPVLTLRELTVSGVLGQLSRLDIAAPPQETLSQAIATADLAAFLNPANHPLVCTLATDSQPKQPTITIAITGSAGSATATGDLTGDKGVLTTVFGNRSRTIPLTPSQPDQTEWRLFLAAPLDSQC
ncbi:MAG TPA: hypothetical protein PKY10_16675, partial [Lentisphaeria bacterium]|nr:hypothetical protein [Lentisphaeria bacterium]